MLRYVIRRILLMIPTLAAVLLISFLLVRISGDPARFVLGELAPPEAVAQFRAAHGLDQPLHVQLGTYVSNLFRGDLGQSLRYQEPVLSLFAERVPATLELGLSAFAMAVIVGLTLGIVSALRQGTALDRAVRFTVLMGQAIPGFYLGLVLIVLVSVRLGWFPTGGRGGIPHLVLPTIALGAQLTAFIVRFTRSLMLDTLQQDYVRTARAKGATNTRVVWYHALRNAFIPLLTVLALQSSVIFSGSIVTETVFSWPGIGRFAVQAITTRDYPVVQGTVLILTSFVVVLNLAVDVAYAYLDPRIRYS